MYRVKQHSENVIEVKEMLVSWHTTKTTYWYYDVERWLKTVLGEKNEIPSEIMTQREIDWCQRYYLPKLEKEYAKP